MEITGGDQDLQAVLADEVGFDNDALDFQQLEEYITNDNNLYFPVDIIPAVAFPNDQTESLVSSANITSKLSRQEEMQQGQANMYCIGLPPSINFKNHVAATSLPESPPDSEPYSPPDDRQDTKHSISSAIAISQQMYPSTTRVPPSKGFTSYLNNEPPKLNHLPTTQTQPVNLPPAPSAMNPQLIPQHYGGLNNYVTQANNLNKKRKYSDSPNNTMTGSILNGMNGILNIKQEPPSTTIVGYLPDCNEDDYPYDLDANSFIDGSYQVIKWQPFQPTKWAVLCDDTKELPTPSYRVDADKGFNYSVPDDAFVCQKKNHFQVTVHINISGDPKYIKTTDGIKKIDSYYLHFNGIKMESTSQTIKIEQSQSDRSKKPFFPTQVDIQPGQITKVTVGRLHFSETTSNNMRKKGKPNPDQRYFMLVVALHAHCAENNYMISAHVSEKIIVRASNPGQFDSDVDVLWQKGHTQDSVYHVGRVGVNTDHPEEAVTVHGNMRVTGHIMHPSDIRVKENFKEVDSKEQLRNVTQMRIYKYSYNEDYAEQAGMSDDERLDTGILAQDVREVLPDAVRETGDIVLPNGRVIENFLILNKDRIYMENIGAVKELCKLTDNLENRIDELEEMNKKLTKLKRFDSLKSTMSTKSGSSVKNSMSPKKPCHHSHVRSSLCSHHHQQSSQKMCSNKFIQLTIIILILIMAFCLVSITVLYIMERHKENSHLPSSLKNVQKSNQHLHTTTTQTSPVTHSSTFQPSTSKMTKLVEHVTKRPTMPPYPPCKLGNCEQFCCPLPFEIEPADGIGAQSPSYRLTNVSGIDSLSDQPMTIKPLNNKDNSEPPQVILNNHDQDHHHSYLYDTHNKEESNEIIPYFRFVKIRPKRSRARTDNTDPELKASISIKQLNFSIDSKFCTKSKACSDGNFSFEVPLSPYFSYNTVDIIINITPGHMVILCKNITKQTCDTSGNAPPTLTISSQTPYTLKIPIGRFIQCNFLFRISRAYKEKSNNVCSAPPDKLGQTFSEYHLGFHRTCNPTHGTK